MNEIIENLDNIGHSLGIGGFESVIGALVISLAALVIVVHSFSLLRRTRNAKKQTKNQRDGYIHNPQEWIEDPEKTIGWDHGSKALGVGLLLPGEDMDYHPSFYAVISDSLRECGVRGR
ncbi:MAG: hypothetical protein ABSG48_11505 [Geobacteraceae bacterium]